MKLPSTNIHLNPKHIDRQLNVLIDDKIRLFKKHNLKNASLNEQVGIISDYDFIYTNKDCGGYCDYENKIIALSKCDNIVWTRKVVLHEIGHSLQATHEIFYRGDLSLLSTRLNWEHQVETIAFKMYNAIYDKKLPAKAFNSYFETEDVKWLADWYGNSVHNDILIKTK